MLISILQIIAIFVFPLLIIRFHNFKLTKLLGTIGMAYLLGLIVSGLVFGINQIGLDFSLNTNIGEIGSFAAIGIAIPLLLFNANLKEAKKLSKPVLLSFGSLIVSVIIVVSLAFIFYGRNIVDGAVLSAMAVGVYTGGTPNLNAIGNIFGLDRSLILIANLSDMIIGAFIYIFLLILCKPLLLKILKPSKDTIYLKEESNVINTEDLEGVKVKLTKPLLNMILLAFGIAVISALAGVIIWIMLGSVQGTMNDYLVPALMVGVTVLGIIASFNKKIREVKGTNVVGHYLILVFSFALASSLTLTNLGDSFGKIFIFFSVVTIGVFILHVIFARILRIDADCTMVTVTAGVFGPAFIPAITKQIKNDNLTVPGLICGSIGYAIGTFIGLVIGLLFMI